MSISFCLGKKAFFSGVAYCKQTSKFVVFGSAYDFLYHFGLVAHGIWKAVPNPSAAAASSMFSTAHHAEAK